MASYFVCISTPAGSDVKQNVNFLKLLQRLKYIHTVKDILFHFTHLPIFHHMNDLNLHTHT